MRYKIILLIALQMMCPVKLTSGPTFQKVDAALGSHLASLPLGAKANILNCSLHFCLPLLPLPPPSPSGWAA